MENTKNKPPERFLIRKLPTQIVHAFRHRYFFVFGLTVTALVINEIYHFGTDISDWDPLLISTVLTFIIGVRLAINLPDTVDETLERLVKRGVIKFTDTNQFINFKQKLESQTAKYAHWNGIVFSVAILAAFVFVFRLKDQILLTILEVFGGYFIGWFLGHAISYGRLRDLLKEQGSFIQAQPGHLDSAAGLKPIGDLFFFQAVLIAIPAIYLAAWWFIFPHINRSGYAAWREPYAVLFSIVLAIEILAFLLPIWSFHTEMKKQKSQYLVEADILSQNIVRLQAELVITQSAEERGDLKERLAIMTQRYWEIENMPTWPVDARVQRRFTLGNLGLLLPFIARFLNTNLEPSDSLWDSIKNLFTAFFQ